MKQIIKTMQGDITKINNVDAIVNAANNSLSNSKQFCG